MDEHDGNWKMCFNNTFSAKNVIVGEACLLCEPPETPAVST